MTTDIPNETRRPNRYAVIPLVTLGIVIVLVFLLFVSATDKPSVLIGAGVKEGSLSTESGKAGSNGDGRFSIQINAMPSVVQGKLAQNLNIVNPKTNTLYITVDITLADTEEVIYASGAIPPDHHITEDEFIRALPQGTHLAKASVKPFDPEDPEYSYNTANFELEIHVES